MTSVKNLRAFLKSGRASDWETIERDQDRGVPTPPLQQPYPDDAQLVDLVPPGDLEVPDARLLDTMHSRRSHRRFAEEPLSLAELSLLLWATQGVKRVLRDGTAALRTVPSGGGRHPLETYLLIHRVGGTAPGLYRYLALEHKLSLLRTEVGPVPDQWFVRDCAAVFIWTAVPYRTEWRHAQFAHKMIAMDAGHACQNLYLACEAIGAGTCAIGVYPQDEMDAWLGLDGEDEFTIYVAPVGKVP